MNTANIFAVILLAALTAWAQSAGTKRIDEIKFKPRQRITVVEGTVAPPSGQGDMTNSGSERYSLRARAGQFLTIEAGSDNDGAVFSLFKPSRNMAKDEVVEKAAGVKRWSGKLRKSGEYVVTVFTRDREAASRFKLRVTLR